MRLFPVRSAASAILFLLACPRAIALSQQLPRVDGMVVAKPDTNFRELSRIPISGTKDPRGGCRVGWRIKGKRGESGAERFVQWNFETCQFVLARGAFRVPPPRRTPNANAKRVRDVPKATLPNAPQFILFDPDAAPAISAMTLGSGGMYQEIYHLDPPGIRVTEQDFWFDWSWDNGCVSPGSGYQTVYWASGSGWREPSTSYQPNGADCYSTGMSATANFRNEVFCAPYGTVYVDYTQRTIGYDNGDWEIDWQGFATGAECAEWLTGYHSYYTY